MQPTIHRSERICIDISDNVISIIKLDPDGVMMRAGSAKAPTMPAVPDDAYVTDLSSAIRKAAWAAKVSMGFGASCVVVSGMPDIVIQRFTWPEMPEDALLSIVQEEMIPYLPGNPSHYTISCEVLKRGHAEGQAIIEVLAAAMPIEHTAAINTACRWANFKPKRMDLRENARGRFAHYWCAPVEGEVPTTYAILDAGPGLANIAFYYNGLFHSNRYFTPEMVRLNDVADFEMLMTVKAGGVDDNENAMRYDPEKLSEEIISSVNHFHRSIPGGKLACVLLMDEENIPGIEENLRANLNMLVLKPSQWVSPGIKRPNLRRVEPDQFLDAFAAGMPPLSDHGSRMDLRIPSTPIAAADRSVYQPVNIVSHVNSTPPPEPVKPGAGGFAEPQGFEPAHDQTQGFEQAHDFGQTQGFAQTHEQAWDFAQSQGSNAPSSGAPTESFSYDEPIRHRDAFPEQSSSHAPSSQGPIPFDFDDPYAEIRPEYQPREESSRQTDAFDFEINTNYNNTQRSQRPFDEPFSTRQSEPVSHEGPFQAGQSESMSYDDSFLARHPEPDSYAVPFSTKQSGQDSYVDPFPARPPEPDPYVDPFPARPPESDPYVDPFPARPPEPDSYVDPFPAKPTEPITFDFDDPYADINPIGSMNPQPATQPIQPEQTKHHEFPFDPIKAQQEEHNGFPYAMPADPPRSLKPIIAAAAVAAVIFLIAVLIPLQETLNLRSELQYLENSIASHVSVDALIMLERERGQAYAQINARRREIDRISEGMTVVRNFYSRAPALAVLPEVLDQAGIQVDFVEANQQRVNLGGRTNALRTLPTGLQYLRNSSQLSHLFNNVSFDAEPTPDNTGVDAYGFTNYTIDITLRPSYMPFWLNGQVERSWP